MKLSKMHIKTLREVPAEAEIPSHILLLRTGMIRKLASGIYGFMPFGWRSVKKIEDIIRQEMDAASLPCCGRSPAAGSLMDRSFGG